jgi:metallopeptidase MepB
MPFAPVSHSTKASTLTFRSSQVYSADMWYTSFKADPMNGKEGRRYRHTVLERGGSQEEMQTLEDFLGRKPSTEAFYKELGLDSK